MGRSQLGLVLATSALMTLPFACGGRNLNAFLLGDEIPDDNAGGNQAAGGMAAGGDPGVGGAGGAGGPSGPNGPGSGPGPSSGPGGIQDCFTCAAQNCPEAVDCFLDSECQAGIACAVSECLSGGAPDIACFLQCFDGDTELALMAFDALTCVFMSCQEDCAGLLGGGFP